MGSKSAFCGLYDGLYFISDDGRLYSTRSNKFLKPDTDRYGYVYYVISIHGKRMTLKAHRLVAQAFLPNPQEKPTVNHKNGIRHDNRVDNLEWATEKEQSNDPLTKVHLLCASKQHNYQWMGSLRNFGRKETAVYKGDALLGVYPTLMKASHAHKVNYSKASECANGKRKLAGGLKFCFL